jgi:DNA-binding transcriptional LysR family regulator
MDKVNIPFSLRQLRYFVAASDALSVTVAARRLHISQPSISSALAELEDLFGAQLFLRHHAQGISLTPAGHRLLREARELLKHAHEVMLIAGEFSNDVAGPIAIGCLVTIAPILLSALTNLFTEQYPLAQVRFVEGDHQTLLSAMCDGTLDCVLTYDLRIDRELDFQALVDLPPYALLPAQHRLAKKKQINLADLCDEPMVLLDLPVSREYFLSLFSEAHLKPRIAHQSAHGDVVRAMVANGFGYSIWNFPCKSNQALDGRQFIVRPLQKGLSHTTLGLATIRSAHTRKIVQAFSEFCTDEIPRLVQW